MRGAQEWNKSWYQRLVLTCCLFCFLARRNLTSSAISIGKNSFLQCSFCAIQKRSHHENKTK